MSDCMGVGLVIGMLVSVLILVVSLWGRASWVRTRGGESYYRGWEDARKKIKQNLDNEYFSGPPEREK